MKRRGSNRKLLFGSFSIASAILIISGIIAPRRV